MEPFRCETETIENHISVPPGNCARPRIPERPSDWLQMQNRSPRKREHLDPEVFCVFSVPVSSTVPKAWMLQSSRLNIVGIGCCLCLKGPFRRCPDQGLGSGLSNTWGCGKAEEGREEPCDHQVGVCAQALKVFSNTAPDSCLCKDCVPVLFQQHLYSVHVMQSC